MKLNEPPHALGTLVSGKYRLEAVLGSGAMGVVVAATQVALARRVAVKFLRADLATDAEAVRRFVREARAAAGLRSEHAVRILDVEPDPPAPYIVMECLEGEDLAALLARQGRLPVTEAVDCVLQAAKALGEAHARGIVHRDLKPANLFRTHAADGAPLIKVVDFGMSKVAAREGSGSLAATHPAAMLGSPLYAAPEQLLGAATVDGRADIWSLGVLLYELASGQRPFSGQNLVDLCMQIVNEPHTPLRAHLRAGRDEDEGGARGGALQALEPIVDRCLAKAPADRYDDVAALVAALAPHGLTGALAPAAAALPPARRRDRARAAAGGALLLAGATVLAYQAGARRAREAEPAEAPPPPPVRFLADRLRSNAAHTDVAMRRALLQGGKPVYVASRLGFTNLDAQSHPVTARIECAPSAQSAPPRPYRSRYSLTTHEGGPLATRRAMALQGLFTPPADGEYDCFVVAWAQSLPACQRSDHDPHDVCPEVLAVDREGTTFGITRRHGEGAEEWDDPLYPDGLCIDPGAGVTVLEREFAGSVASRGLWVDSGVQLTEDHEPADPDPTPCNRATGGRGAFVAVTLTVEQLDGAKVCGAPTTRTLADRFVSREMHHMKIFAALTSVPRNFDCPSPPRYRIRTRVDVTSGNSVLLGGPAYSSTIARNLF